MMEGCGLQQSYLILGASKTRSGHHFNIVPLVRMLNNYQNPHISLTLKVQEKLGTFRTGPAFNAGSIQF